MVLKFDKITIGATLLDMVGSAKVVLDVDTEEDLANLTKEVTIEKASVDIVLKKVSLADYATLRGMINQENDVKLENENAVAGSPIVTIKNMKIYPKLTGENSKTLEVQITRDKRFGVEDYANNIVLAAAV